MQEINLREGTVHPPAEKLCHCAARGVFVTTIQINAYNLRDPGLLHRNSVDYVCLGHGAFAVGDNDELRAGAHVGDQLREAANVRLVEGRIHLVEDTERRRLELEDPDQ
jgi:hypothetical protein